MSSSSARHRLALVALAGLVLAGHVGAPERTSAAFTSTASTQAVVATAYACAGGPTGYASGLLDDAAPLLRWSFSAATSGGAADPSSDPSSGPAAGPAAGTVPGASGPAGTSTTGLLVCDPADLAAGGDAGPTASRSLDLNGSVGGGSTSAPVAPSGSMSLLLWVQAGTGDGEVASLSLTPDAAAPAGADAVAGAPSEAAAAGPTAPAPDALVIGLVGGTVQLTEVRGGTTSVLSSVPISPGEAHLVAAVLAVAGDGSSRATLAVDDGPTTPPVPLATSSAGASLTVGARPTATAAVAGVDEVTLLAGEVDSAMRGSLLGADRWWSPSARSGSPSPG